MISKKLFVKRINQIISFEKDVDKFDSALREFSKDKDFTGFFMGEHIQEEIDFLQELIDPKDDTIAYWFYELDRGKVKHTKNCIEDNGKKYSLRTPEELYDYLMKDKCDGKK